MSKIEVDAIDKQSGSTLTLGGSGTAVTLACGATQTGFGRTGTVDWQTGSIKSSANFTAVSGEGYFVDTSSNPVTVNLPAGVAGAIVAINDYKDNFATNNVTISPNGTDKLSGTNLDGKLSVNGQAVTLVFVDSTEGWKTVNDSQNQILGLNYVTATGGTTSNSPCGNFKIHTFTGPGTFCVSAVSDSAPFNKVDYLIVGGGGGGGSGNPASGEGGGGGGAGGLRASSGTDTGSYCAGPGPVSACVAARTVTAQGYAIVVGGGGPGGTAPSDCAATSGGNSSFDTIVGAGGGGGATRNMTTPTLAASLAKTGGSGGGESYHQGPGSNEPGAAGNTPPVSPSQGNPGGQHICASAGGGGGIGGAGGRGTTCTAGGPAGVGVQSSITGSAVGYAGGGGGGTGGPTIAPAPPVGGGGAGANPTTCGTTGTAATGGGGGGGDGSRNGQNGGGGIVILRYRQG